LSGEHPKPPLWRTGERPMNICLKVSDELWARFDAFAVTSGATRAAAIRRLMAAAVEQPLLAACSEKIPRHPVSFTIRIDRQEQTALLNEAQSMGQSQSAWISALVRRRLSNKPTFNRSERIELAGIHAELRRAATSVSHMARANDLAFSCGQSPSVDARYLEAIRVEIRQHMIALRQAFEGNLASWAVEP
jgi:hypothetical protein